MAFSDAHGSPPRAMGQAPDSEGLRPAQRYRGTEMAGGELSLAGKLARVSCRKETLANRAECEGRPWREG